MRTGSSNLSLFEDEVLFNFPLLPSIIFIQGGNYLGNQNCPVPFQMDIGYSALLTFQAVCTVRGSWADPGCHLDASSRALAPTWPSSSSAHESRDLSASCTAGAPGVLCGQHFKGDARMGYGAGGQPFPKPSFAANTSFGKSSGLRGV